MSTEAQQMAARAWAAMSRKGSILDTITGASAMPAVVALDMVQDVTGCRQVARRELFYCAAAEVREGLPKENDWDIWVPANAVVTYLIIGSWAEAELHLSMVEDRATSHSDFALGLIAKHHYWLWAREARRILGLLEPITNVTEETNHD